MRINLSKSPPSKWSVTEDCLCLLNASATRLQSLSNFIYDGKQTEAGGAGGGTRGGTRIIWGNSQMRGKLPFFGLEIKKKFFSFSFFLYISASKSLQPVNSWQLAPRVAKSVVHIPTHYIAQFIAGVPVPVFCTCTQTYLVYSVHYRPLELALNLPWLLIFAMFDVDLRTKRLFMEDLVFKESVRTKLLSELLWECIKNTLFARA